MSIIQMLHMYACSLHTKDRFCRCALTSLCGIDRGLEN
jgi:hypothetical protein